MSKSKFWTPDRLMSLKDIDGEIPEIFIVAGNRTAGKTFGCKKYMINGVKMKKYRKILCIVRFGHEVDKYCEDFFADIGSIVPEFKNDVMTFKRCMNEAYNELFLNDVSIGYVVALNKADLIKRHFASFITCDICFLDEFQSETGNYCPKEIEKFFSLHTSIARGGDGFTRYVPVLMASNCVSQINPYYSAMGIHKRIQKETKTLRGPGWVLENIYNENAANELEKTGFGKAFAGSKILDYSTGKGYLVDASAFVENVGGEKYPEICLKSNGQKCCVWRCSNGLYYIAEKFDPSFNLWITANIGEHSNDTLLTMGASNMYIKTLRTMFEYGLVRFQNFKCKDIFMDVVALKL